MTIAMSVPVAVATVLYFALMSRYLPMGNDLALASECLFGGGNGRVIPFVWGVLLRLSWWLVPGPDAFRLGFASALSGVVAVVGFIYVVSRLLPNVAAFADRHSRISGVGYWFFPPLATLLGGLAFVLSPAFFSVATRVGPMATEIALATLPFVLASFVQDVTRTLSRIYVIVLIGVTAGFAALEGAPGVLVLPVAFMLVWLDVVRGKLRIANACGYFTIGLALAALVVVGDGLDVPRVRLSFHLGYVQVILFAVVPVLMLCQMVKTRHLVRLPSRLWFFGGWLFICALMPVWIVKSRPLGFGKAADAFVEASLASLGDRKWIVSDGAFDDLLMFKKPAAAHLVTYRRELDPKHGRELAAWAKADLAADGDLLLAAELGPSEFLDLWMRRGGAVTNCLFVTALEPALPRSGKGLRPDTYSWGASFEGTAPDAAEAERRWREAWRSFRPLLSKPGEPGADRLRSWFSTQGNAIGALLQEAGKKASAWAVYDFAIREMDASNLSLLVNADELVRGGFAPGREGERIAGLLRAEIDGIHTTRQLRYRLSKGGRLYVSEETRGRLAAWRERMRIAARESRLGKGLEDILEKLRSVEALSGDARNRSLSALEARLPQLFGGKPGTAWMRNLLQGEIDRLRGGERLRSAQKRFRKAIRDGEGNVRLAFERLLVIDVKLGDTQDIEYDALLILRRDVTHQLANAMLGSARLEQGDCESAVRFLQRAVSVGIPQPGVQNDLALALSGIGRHREAEALMREVVKAMPGNWHVLDSLSTVLAAAGKADEAALAARDAEASAERSAELVKYRELLERRGRGRRKGWFR